MIAINQKNFWMLAAFAIALLLVSDPSIAGSAAGLPWEGPLEKIKQSMTGPVAMVISLVGIVVGGGMLIFGGELGEFARRIIMLVLVISLLVMANAILTNLYGSAGAVITHPAITAIS